MRILHVVTGLTRANGVSVFVCELAAEQLCQGHQASILVKSLDEDRYPLVGGVSLISAKEFDGSFSSYDVVHIHALWTPWLTRMSSFAHKAGVKVVWSPHGMLTPWALKNKWPKKVLGLLLYQYWSLRKADAIHVTAASEGADVRRLRLHNPLVRAPLGVRLAPKVDDEERCAPKTRHVVLFVSRVQRKKGLPNLLKAWARMSQEVRTEWCVKIVGPDEDGHMAELKGLCARLGLSFADKGHWGNNGETVDIEFLGPVYGEGIKRLYRDSDVFVLPTHSENFGSVVIEALAEELPVICTKGAPWCELVEWRCGRWIDIGIEPLYAALCDIISLSDEERLALGERGRRLVESRYTWAAVAKAVCDGYGKAGL